MASTIEQYKKLKEASEHLSSFKEKLIAIQDFLQDFQDLIDTKNDDITLETIQELGIVLTFEGANLDEGSWSDEQLQMIFDAVMAMVKRFAKDHDGELIFGLMLFKEIFGSIELQLFEGNFGDSSYASTSEDGNIIYLYTQPKTELLASDLIRCGEEFGLDNPTRDTCVNLGFIPTYTSKNIVHEFGHVLVNRHGGSAGGIFEEWQEFVKVISEFNENVRWGWSDTNFSALENREENLSLVLQENERVANLFEAWINGRVPNLDDSGSDTRKKRAAWAMWSFMTGECPPDDVKIDLTSENQSCGKGLINWLLEYGGQNE